MSRSDLPSKRNVDGLGGRHDTVPHIHHLDDETQINPEKRGSFASPNDDPPTGITHSKIGFSNYSAAELFSEGFSVIQPPYQNREGAAATDENVASRNGDQTRDTIASAEVLRTQYNLRINPWKILKNSPPILWASLVGVIFAGLSDRRANHKAGLETLFDFSAFFLNVFLATLIFQRAMTTAKDSLLHLRDRAYMTLVISALFIAICATIPSLPLANDAARELFPNATVVITGLADAINGVNTFLTRFLGAIAILLLTYMKFFIEYCQPDRHFLLQVRDDLNDFPSLHPAGSENINDDFLRRLYAEGNDFNVGKNSPTRPEVIAKWMGYALFVIALGTGPLWYDLTSRGADRLISGVPTIVRGILSAPSVGFYGRFLYLYPTNVLKTFQLLMKELGKILNSENVGMLLTMIMSVAVLLIITALSLASGTGLGSEGLAYFQAIFNNTFAATAYSYFCTLAAGAVNENGVLSLTQEIFSDRDRYKGFDFSLKQAIVQKFLKCYEVEVDPGVWKSVEEAYQKNNQTSYFKEKNKYELTHGVHQITDIEEAKRLRDSAMQRAEDRRVTAALPFIVPESSSCGKFLNAVGECFTDAARSMVSCCASMWSRGGNHEASAPSINDPLVNGTTPDYV